MSSHLDRLMRLAQKTGDTLIIHDKTGKDVVVMDVDHYEMMHDMQDIYSDNHGCECGSELYEMNEGEMLDKINRDIAIWRSHKEMEDSEYGNHVHESDLDGGYVPDFSDESPLHTPEWYKAGDILGNKHPDFFEDDDSDEEEEDVYNWDDENDDDDGITTPENNFDSDPFSPVDDLDEGQLEDEVSEIFEDKNDDDEVMYDSLGEASLGSVADKKDIPFVKHDEEKETFKEEILDDDEPVFFEEPV